MQMHLPRQRSLRTLVILAATVAQTAPGAALASAGPALVAVEQVLTRQIAAVRGHDGGVPVLLPTTMRLARPVYGARVPQRSAGYQLVLGSSRACDGANVCLVAAFAATPGARAYGSPVTLAHGIRGAYAAAHCAGDCTAAAVGWTERGILYTIEARPAVPAGSVRAALVAAADEAIDAGPR
jgi:hypothetical protein